MATPLRVHTDRCRDGTTVVSAAGELDLSNVAEFSAALDAAVRSGVDGTPVRVDLTRIEYLDSGAINVLFEHADAIDVLVNPILMSVLTISGLAKVTTVAAAPPD
ncbi:STAS domain-containing protein [Mycolicibacterium sp. 018/SC-01/001]|uniref:STAS domain-containing protein n=1 Tax=Mycolicibacterium sp. 018/SC-01/001 TaxID=2592069 RepID=UPI00117C9B61|nr:STAS domain-containing protein [Mycolicibacterium sp. 018/SC-01/001]TRW77582.1 STAS domain-containing protein [Mycolicibacterium sp. 018/SC-01/001]